MRATPIPAGWGMILALRETLGGETLGAAHLGCNGEGKRSADVGLHRPCS